MIVDALKNTQGNIARAAQLLGISERVIGLRIKKYNIDTKRFRETKSGSGPPRNEIGRLVRPN